MSKNLGKLQLQLEATNKQLKKHPRNEYYAGKILSFEIKLAEKRMEKLRSKGYATHAFIKEDMFIIRIKIKKEIKFIKIPIKEIHGLMEIKKDQIEEIRISPSGLGLSWPKIDLDISVIPLVNKYVYNIQCQPSNQR